MLQLKTKSIYLGLRAKLFWYGSRKRNNAGNLLQSFWWLDRNRGNFSNNVFTCLKKKTTKLNSTTFRSDCVSLKFESHKILPNHTFVKYLRIPFVPFSDSAILCDCSLTWDSNPFKREAAEWRSPLPRSRSRRLVLLMTSSKISCLESLYGSTCAEKRKLYCKNNSVFFFFSYQILGIFLAKLIQVLFFVYHLVSNFILELRNHVGIRS